VPRLLAMLIIALLGWVVAYVLKVSVRGILRVVKFDKLSDNAGATQLLNKLALPSSSELLSRVVFWMVWMGFILLGVQVLGIVGLQEYISRFFLYLPRLFVALFIVFFGLVAASFFSRAALLAAVNADSPSPGLLATLIRTIIVIFAVTMAFEQLGLAERTILVAFAIAFGALMLGLAIAFGMGGRDLAKQFLERRFLKEKEEQKQDELSPL
jgi:signal transduction histidine kinase